MERTPTLDLVDDLTDIADERIAAACSFPLLITAPSTPAVVGIARRVHTGSARTAGPFVEQRAGALPPDSGMLEVACSDLIAAATGGSLLLSAVEELPLIVQKRLAGLLVSLRASGDAPTVRLMAGTTVSLRQRMSTGTFLEALFYLLNVIHLVATTRDASGHRRTATIHT